MNEQASYTPDEREALRRGRMMTDLIDMPGWRELKTITDAWTDVREKILLLPSHENPSLAGLTEAEKKASEDYLKGVLYGIRLAISAPQAMIDDMKGITVEKASEEAND